MTEVRECARGCTIVLYGDETESPAVALDGAILCARCLGSIAWHLDDAADVAARARLAVVPGGGSAADERVSGSRDPGIPLNAAAMDACDDVVGMLGRWVVYWAETLQVAPPQALAGALAAGRDVEGVRAGTDPAAVASGLLEWAAWVKGLMPRIERLDAVVAFHDELGETIRRVGRMFPRDSERKVQQQKPRYCPVCELQQVWVTWAGRDPSVTCGSCGWKFETEWGELLDAIGLSGGGR